jgi:hypothetical protein
VVALGLRGGERVGGAPGGAGAAAACALGKNATLFLQRGRGGVGLQDLADAVHDSVLHHQLHASGESSPIASACVANACIFGQVGSRPGPSDAPNGNITPILIDARA